MKPAHGSVGYAGEHQSGALARPGYERWSGVNRLRRFNITRGCAKYGQSPTKLAWCPHRYGLRPSRPAGSHNQRYVLRPSPATATSAARTLLNSLISALALARQCVRLVRRCAQGGEWSPRPPGASLRAGLQPLRVFRSPCSCLATHPPPRGLPEIGLCRVTRARATRCDRDAGRCWIALNAAQWLCLQRSFRALRIRVARCYHPREHLAIQGDSRHE